MLQKSETASYDTLQIFLAPILKTKSMFKIFLSLKAQTNLYHMSYSTYLQDTSNILILTL